jgi:uncharacterized protein (DUF302 family)
MVHIVETNKSVQEVEKDFPEVAAKHKFGVLGVYNLRQKMNEKGVPFEHDCLVFEVCNPQQAKRILDGNMVISTVLPCRVSVYEDGGRTKLATIQPTALLGLFENPELRPVAEEVERTLSLIMEEAARLPVKLG